MLTLRFFGTFEARVDGRPLRRLQTRKGQFLLALLALRESQEVDRAWVAGTLWPESPEPLARSSLRRCLTDLRSALGPEAARLAGPSPRILRLDLQGADVDLLAFDEALREGGIEALRRAVDLYRGPLLEDCSEEWVLEDRRAREEAYLRAIEDLAAQLEAAGTVEDAIAYRRRAIALAPLRETVPRDLMSLLARLDRYGEAVQVYRDLRLHLHRELQAEPSPETVRLYQRIRQEGRSEAIVRPRVPTEVRPGPPLRRLPSPLTRLIGRENEIRQVVRCLEGARLVTLTGAGGVGKTRLAIQVAEEVADDCPDGVAFVDLAPLSDPSLVPQAVADAVEVSGPPGRPVQDALLAALRTRALLLVLDNCEHLVEACASLAAALLQGCPSLRILATSRHALGITGETLLRTPSLSLPDPEARRAGGRALLAGAQASEAVRLFVERAGAVDPTFGLTETNAPAVAAICERLEGIPLALEMAAARARAFSPEEILDRLRDRFRFVVSDGSAVSSRQQTLEAALDWSYGLLSEPEQALLRRLSVFAGGFSRETAKGVCALEGELGSPAELGIESLLDKSLLQRRAGWGGRSRFAMLETVREYGALRLEQTGETQDLRGQHARFFLDFAEGLEAGLLGPRQGETLARLEEEHGNLRAALHWSLGDRGDAEAGLRLAGALHWFWLLHTHYAEGRRWIQQALARVGPSAPPAARAKGLQGAGQLAFYQADSAGARSYLEESAALYRGIGDRRGTARSMIYLGAATAMLGDHEAARSCFQETLGLSRGEGDAWGLGMALWMWGWFQRDRCDDPTEALRYLRESEQVLREVGDPWALSTPLFYQGEIHRSRGNYPEALRCMREALGLVRGTEDRMRTMLFMVGVGRTLYASGDEAGARPYYEEGALLFERLDELETLVRFALQRGTNLAEVYLHLGHIHGREGNEEASRAAYERSLKLYSLLGDAEGKALAERALRESYHEGSVETRAGSGFGPRQA